MSSPSRQLVPAYPAADFRPDPGPSLFFLALCRHLGWSIFYELLLLGSAFLEKKGPERNKNLSFAFALLLMLQGGALFLPAVEGAGGDVLPVRFVGRLAAAKPANVNFKKPKSLTCDDRAKRLKVMVKTIEAHGVEPDDATDLFTVQGKSAYAITRECLIPMSAEAYDSGTVMDRKTYQALFDRAEELRHGSPKLSISTGETPFCDEENPLGFKARDADKHQLYRECESETKNAKVVDVQVGPEVFNDAQALALFLGHDLISGSSHVAWIQFFMNRGEKPRHTKDPSLAKDGEKDKAIPTDEGDLTWYRFFRQEFCQALGRCFLNVLFGEVMGGNRR